MAPEYCAHIRRDEISGELVRQSVAEHLTGTAVLCGRFAGEFGAEDSGRLAGLTHDVGK